ncbi:MAG: hypothetical protein ACUVXG_14155 [Anaerolineae bacterium]
MTVVYAFPIKVGGGKPRCLGSVRFHPKQVRLVPAEGKSLFEALRQGGAPPESLLDQLLEWLGDDTLLDREAWDKFRQEAKPREGTCPKEVY